MAEEKEGAILNHPPLYYTLIAVPLRLLRYADVRTQLYAARAVSLLLEPRVTLRQEPDLSLDRTLVAAWRDTVRRLVWR